MKSLSIVLSVLLLTTFSACSHFSITDGPWPHSRAPAANIPPELNAFLDAASEAAKQIALADTVGEWQTECDKVEESRNQILDEALTATQRKQCDQIMEQMEIGKLSVEMKKVDAKMGKKQCSLVAAEIVKNVKMLKNGDSKGKA